jgi:aspartate ammonia-lyase
MPGKVNPVIPEAVNQVAFQIIGNDLALTIAAEGGQLQLNVMEPLIAFKIFDSIRLLQRAMDMLREHCIVGITANEARCRELVEHSASSTRCMQDNTKLRVNARSNHSPPHSPKRPRSATSLTPGPKPLLN